MRVPTRWLSVLLGLVATSTVGAPPAHADPIACQREIVKMATKLAATRIKALQQCEDRVLKGAGGGPCPDERTAVKIAKADSKLRASIAKRCGGGDRACGTADDEPLEAIGWDLGSCPDFEQAGCDDPIVDCDDIGACVACVDTAAVDQAIALAFDGFAPSGDRDVVKCQRTIGKEAAKFFDQKTKALRTCEDGVLKGRAAGPCPDEKATSKITRAAIKLSSKICRACGGADKACATADDLPLAAIGFADTCPDVTVPGGPACAAPIDDLQDVVACVNCVLEFKADCHDALTVPGLKSYPAECAGPAPPATPTPTPTPTATPTPSQTCGNDTVEGDEECDGTDDALCPGACQASCRCPQPCTLPSPLPAVLSFVAKADIDLDSGWTGLSHDFRGPEGATLLSARTSNCDTDLQSPTCGQCDLDGPILFTGSSRNCICLNLADRDGSSRAVCDPEAPSDCTAPETCECLLGPPLPLSSGAVPVCVVNRSTTSFTGTANVADTGPHAGSGGGLVTLESGVHNGLDTARPCPTCVGDLSAADGARDGACDGGAHDGTPCDVAGVTAFFGPVSFDCLPASASNTGNLTITLDTTTGTTSLATGPACTAAGFGALSCFCDTCATAAAEPCNDDADCPGSVACGGLRCLGGSNLGAPCGASSDCPGGFCGRPGQPTAPNQCSDASCSPNPADPDNPNEGVCSAGPFDGTCSEESFRGCTNTAECNPPPSGTCDACAAGQTCSFGARQCFLDPIVRTGTPGVAMGVVAATFCIAPTASASINQVAGLPGPGALLQPTRFFRAGALCGNGGLDVGEACDPPADAACPGECQPDCRCLNQICGDGVVNQPGEECDGVDDAACPGGCQADCLCGSFCGDDLVNAPGEECDGTADAACPGVCQPDCRCPVCGDGTVNQASEQCDGGDDAACPGACQPDCQCGPFCGDDVVNQVGEECDGSDTGTCSGSCEVDCTCAPFCGDGVREGAELCDGGDDAACPGECQGDCTCPAIGELSFIVAGTADLDTGWTGTSHDFGIQAGTRIDGVIGGCDGVSDLACTFFANVGSHCSGDASLACLSSTQCPAPQACVINLYGPPLPLSSGGVPVCVVNRHQIDVTGTYDLGDGSAELTARLSALVHLSTNISQPCPICDCGAADPQDCQIGEPGTCDTPPFNACTVEGTGTFGPTSNACPPNPGSNVSGGGLDILFDPVTTGVASFPSNQACVGAGFASFDCWCDGQTQPNACAFACDGGANDAMACGDDGDCPGAPAGACQPLCRQIAGEPVGEGACVAGPFDQTCAGASEIGCSETQPCPLGLGPCVTEVRRCFLDPIVRVGAPSLTRVTSAATFCIPATSSPAVNNTAGLPGPGAILYENDTTLAYCGDGSANRSEEECDGGDDANCPGACGPACACVTACGNGAAEFGEQCDPGPPADDDACPGLCAAPGGPDECTCPPICGDGFTGPGEQCDPGGPGGSPPPDDEACPGQCNAVTCDCPPPVCGNGEIEAGESCELPAVGCGPLQLCNPTCTACAP